MSSASWFELCESYASNAVSDVKGRKAARFLGRAEAEFQAEISGAHVASELLYI